MRTNPLQTFTGLPQPEAEPASPYLRFSRPGWAALRADAPLTLDEDDLERLRGINVALSMQEVEEIYLPLARLLNLYVAASQDLYRATATFLGHRSAPVPYIIGLAGSVAVGKSTTARILQALLTRWPDHRKVDLVTTDGFLLPNRVLERRGLMRRKGFPESYDLPRMIQFVTELKAGRTPLHIPVYSHHEYDIVPDRFQVIDQPDILIVEGLNVLQTGTLPRGSGPRIFVSDFFDFSVYVHAETRLIEDWYISRFMTFRERAKGDASSFFHRFADLSDEEARHYAKAIWRDINETNLRENILPSKDRARLILGKGEDHAVDTVWLRKL